MVITVLTTEPIGEVLIKNKKMICFGVNTKADHLFVISCFL